MKKIHMLACLIAFILMAPSFEAEADDVHPLMTSKYWGNLGVYFSQRDFSASAEGSVAGITRSLDFESSTGLDDSPDLFIAELGWQFTPNLGARTAVFRV